MMPLNQKLRNAVFSVKPDPRSRSRTPLSVMLLWVSRGYGGAAKARRYLYRRGILKAQRLPCPVISVGNLTTGGTGKTPMVTYLAGLLKDKGYRAAVLSRGYRGTASRNGGVVSDGATLFMGPSAAGDEPFMLAEALPGIPVLVGANRYRSGIRAVETFGSEVLVLDDGFQHLALARDLNLVLLDHERPLADGYLLPRGSLRESVSALAMADGFVLTRCDAASIGAHGIPGFLKRGVLREKPVFYAAHATRVSRVVHENRTLPDFESLEGKRGVAFSGIALNKDFQHSLKAMGCDIADAFAFSDHHFYTREELETIWRRASGLGAAVVATTEKDYVRIRGRVPTGVPLAVIGVHLHLLGDVAGFLDWVLRRIRRSPGDPGARCLKNET